MRIRIILLVAIGAIFGMTRGVDAQKDHIHGKMDPGLAAWIESIPHPEHDSQPTFERIAAEQKIKAFLRDPTTLRILSAVGQNPDVFAELEIHGEQRDKFEDLISDYKSLLESSSKNLSVGTAAERGSKRFEFEREKRRIAKKMNEIFVEFQPQLVSDSLLGDKQILSILIEPTLVSKHLKITDKQKKRLKEKCEKQALEIREFILQKRREACETISQELTVTQQEQLLEVYGSDLLDEWFSAMPTRKLYRTLLSDKEKPSFVEPLGFWKSIEEKMGSPRVKK